MMERQSVVEDADSKAEKEGAAAVFKSHPRKESIVYKSVIDTLYYCCYYHWGETEVRALVDCFVCNQGCVPELDLEMQKSLSSNLTSISEKVDLSFVHIPNFTKLLELSINLVKVTKLELEKLIMEDSASKF